MTQSLSSALTNLSTLLRSIEGVKEAPAKVTAAANQMPFAICYPAEGNVEMTGEQWSRMFHTIALEVHFNPTLIGEAIIAASSYPEKIAFALRADPTLGGAVSSVNSIRYNLGAMEWGKIETIGLRFLIVVKIMV